MSETVFFELSNETRVHLSAEEWRRIDERAEQGGEGYYADLPVPSDEFFKSAEQVYPPADNHEEVRLPVASETLAYFRDQGQEFRLQMGAILDAYVAQAKASQ